MKFSHELSVGNRIIDSEHGSLQAMIAGLCKIIVAGESLAQSAAFCLLDDKLCHYFEVEEGVARAVMFDFTKHELAHQHLQNGIHSIKDRLMAKHGGCSKAEEKACVDSLMNCLIRHIEEDGKPLKTVLDTYLYGFNPSISGGTSALHGCA